MKKKLNLKILVLLIVCWFLVIVSGIAAYYIAKHKQASEYDVLAVPYIKKVIPILSQWNPETTRQLMASEALEGISEERFTQFITAASKMGELQSFEEPVFQKVYSKEETKIDTIVEYTIDVKYTSGEAVIIIRLLVRDGSLEVFKYYL